MNRKIAAILAADVAGYSRLVAADEEGALRRLVDAQVVFKDRVAAFRGRIFNTAGDAILAEFPSAVDATRAALEIQREMAVRNAELPAGDRFHFRIGLNIGDVVEHEGDLLGDGVNVAARIQALAPAGGLAISHWVREHTSGKITVPFRDIGKKALKNIPAPVHVFVADLAPLSPPAGTDEVPASGSSLPLKMIAAGMVLLALGAAAMTQFRAPQSPSPIVAPIETAKPPALEPRTGLPVEQTKAVTPPPAPTAPEAAVVTIPPAVPALPPVTAAPVAAASPPKALETEKAAPVTIEPENTAIGQKPPIEAALPKSQPSPIPDTAPPTPTAPAPSAALPQSPLPATPAPVVSPPVTVPAVEIPRPPPVPVPVPPAKSVVVQPPPFKPAAPSSPARTEKEISLPERKHTCAEVLERAQLGDITPEDRAFLRTQCK